MLRRYSLKLGILQLLFWDPAAQTMWYLQFGYRENGLCRVDGWESTALVLSVWLFVSSALPLGSWGTLRGCIPSFNR